MNIEKFRSDFLARKSEKGFTQKNISDVYGVEQGSLSRFISGKQGLSFNYVVALWPFVYEVEFPGEWMNSDQGQAKNSPRNGVSHA